MTPQKAAEIRGQIDNVVKQGLEVDETIRSISRQSIISLMETINLSELNGMAVPDEGITEKEANELREHNLASYERLKV